MNKAHLFTAGRWLFRSYRLFFLPALLLLTTACADPDDEVGEGLPSPNTALDAVFTDTITVRASTVLTDSVPSSTTSYLLLGRYQDARLGTLTARSYLQPGLTAAFTPDPSLRYDSLVLVLTADAYRYGDTTRTQQIEVHRLGEAFRVGKAYFANDALPYAAATVGRRSFRGRTGLSTLRISLDNGLGQELWNAGQSGQLTTSAEVQARLPGLALTPGAADEAALVRWSAAAGATQLLLYYHDPAAPAEALVYTMSAAGDFAHFFQLQADRAGTSLAALTNARQGLSSGATQEELFIQAGLGIKTKLEFPYLAQLKELGTIVVINAAQLSLETVTSAESRFLPPPAALYPRLTNRANQSGSYFLASDGTAISMPYQRSLSARTGLDQGSYSLSLTSYVHDVLAGTLPNAGILLSPETSAATGRVVLGSAKNTSHPLRLRLYYTRIAL